MDLTSSRWCLIQPKVAASLFGSLRKAKPSNDNLIWPDQPPLNRCHPLHQASAKPNADGRSPASKNGKRRTALVQTKAAAITRRKELQLQLEDLQKPVAYCLGDAVKASLRGRWAQSASIATTGLSRSVPELPWC